MGWTTHEVTNQVPDLADYNLYETDMVLHQAVVREGAQVAVPALADYGRQLGQARIIALAGKIDRQPPQLRAYDRHGHRVDTVDFPDGWHELLTMGCGQGLHESASVARAAAFLLHGQVEAGSLCPLTMTSAAIPILARESWFEDIRPQLFSRTYDPRDLPAPRKNGMLIGMGLTEKQGGSDLRRITTRAVPAGENGRWYRLVGHKWFFSAPTADAHLALALLEDAPACFYVPRRLPDGSLNALRLMQLKDKLGNRSNASAEVEFHDALGVLVGEPGRGIASLAEMAGYTRLDCVLGSTALMRSALVQALHHARYRYAFGRTLSQQPLMRAVLTELALEVEAAVVLAMRLARAVSAGPEAGLLSQGLARIVTPAAKFWVCKRAIGVVAEAMEVLGGNGYVETYGMARLYREAPVNSIWEGSGNVMCLDVLRAMHRHPPQMEALMAWLQDAAHDDDRMRRSLDLLREHVSLPPDEQEAPARRFAGTLVAMVQAALLREHAPETVADAFIASRLSGWPGGAAGMAALPAGAESVLERAWRKAA